MAIVSWGLFGALVITLVVILLVARAARLRESATVRLLTGLQADIRSAATAEGWPLQLGPLPSSAPYVGDLVVWDLQAPAPTVMTCTESAKLGKHEYLLGQALEHEEPVVRVLAPPGSGAKRHGLAAVIGRPGEPLIGLTFLRTRSFAPRELGWANMFTRLVGESIEYLLERRRGTVLSELVDAVDSAEDATQVVQVAVDLLSRAADGMGTTLFRYDSGWFRAEVVSGDIPPEAVQFLRTGFRAGVGLTWEVYRTGEPLYLEEYSSHPEATAELVSFGLRPMAVVPLEPQRGSRLILALGGFTPKRWMSHDLELIERFRQVLRLLLHQRLTEERLAAVMRLERELVVTDLDEMPGKLVEAVVQMVPGAEMGNLLVREGPVFRFSAIVGAPLEDVDELEFTEEEAVRWYRRGEEAFRNGEPRLAVAADGAGLVDVMAPHRVVELAGAGGGAPLANLCLPVVDRGEVVAILNVDAFQDRHAFGDDAFQAIAAFQPLVAFVLRDAELRRRLSVTATTDALTGLPNRRAFDEQVAHAIAAAQRYGTSLALLIMDMVGFKAVNDKYGHRVGDRVLQEVAAALSAVPRGGDVVYRWGGDEFAALLRNVDDEEAQRVARRFAEVVEQVRTVDGPLRISVGCALYPEDAESLGQLLETADARMYQSKEAARGVDPA